MCLLTFHGERDDCSFLVPREMVICLLTASYSFQSFRARARVCVCVCVCVCVSVSVCVCVGGLSICLTVSLSVCCLSLCVFHFNLCNSSIHKSIRYSAALSSGFTLMNTCMTECCMHVCAWCCEQASFVGKSLFHVQIFTHSFILHIYGYKNDDLLKKKV